MSKIAHADERAADRLTIFMLRELYCSAAHAMAKLNPQAAELLFLGADKLITQTIARIEAQQTEGERSTEIAIAVGTRIADVMEEAHGVLRASSERSATGASEVRRAYEALSVSRIRAA